MIVFVIAGKIDCINFTHAVYVANHLATHLPSVKIKIIEKKTNEWQDWLMEINLKNKWTHTKSPIIWKEISRMGGKSYLIGSLSEFWEYCYDYYNLESFLSKSDLLKLVADNLFTYKYLKENYTSTNYVISILGGSARYVEFLLNELENLPIKQKLLIRLLNKFNEQFINSNNDPNIINVSDLKEAIVDCDLLIVLEDKERLENQTFNDWLLTRFAYFRLLSDRINTFAKRNLRIIISNHGPICFDASILVNYCTSIRIGNIIAITADIGYTALDLISKRTDIRIDEMNAPPIWGFVGIKSIVDTKNIIIKRKVYRPYFRAITNNNNKSSTLPLGTIKTELSTLSYIFQDNLDKEIIDRRNDLQFCLERPPILAKIRAISNLLKLWYATDIEDNIISLGVCSNGSFGFSPGIVLSQPVILNEKRIWQPFPDFPIDDNIREKISEQLKTLTNLFNEFGIVGSNLENNFDSIKEESEIVLEKFNDSNLISIERNDNLKTFYSLEHSLNNYYMTRNAADSI